MPRTRTRPHFYLGKVRYERATTEEVLVTRICNDSSEDTVHAFPYGEEDALDLWSIHGRPARLSYWRSEDHGYRITVSNVPYLFPTGKNSYGTWAIDPNAWVTEALNKIQDASPVASVPLAVAELKDMPRTIQSMHEVLTGRQKTHTGLYLTQVYGIDPLVADIKSMLNVQREIAERVASHRRKAKTRSAGGGLSQQATWNSYVTNGGYTGTVWPGAHVQVARQWSPQHNAWYTARIEPTGDLPELLEKIATNPFNMGTPTISDLYNLIPYSFLVDYFSTLGEYVEHQSNLMPYKVKSLCIMCDTSVRFADIITSAVSQKPWYPLQGLQTVHGSYTVRQKFRWVIKNPMPVFAWRPMVTRRQWANIAHLVGHVIQGGIIPKR